MQSDILVGIQYGDEGKGKVSYNLLKNGDYTHCIRYNGGGNAGHTIYHNGKKIVTHQVPTGILTGKVSIIGSGCVVEPKSLFEEVSYLEENGFEVKSLLKISKFAHIVQNIHLNIDRGDKTSKIGTTNRGIGPTYADKYSRTGTRAESVTELKPYLIDIYEYFKENNQSKIFFEGAQGFGIDIDFGNYPYVTSSQCTVGGALQNGVPYSSISKVWGVAKCYETYVGNFEFQPKNEEIFEKIQVVGNEFGATTERKRQINFLDEVLLERAVGVNGVTDLVINKMDILQRVGCWKVRNSISGKILDLENEESFKEYLKTFLEKTIKGINLIFSYSKDKI